MQWLSILTAVVPRPVRSRCMWERLKIASVIAPFALVSACTESPQNQLLSAIVRGDITTVESLLDNSSVDINWRAPKTGQNALGNAAAHNKTAIVKLLMQRGADPNIATFENMTALHSAAYHGYADIAKMLIEAGASVDDAESRYGYTPLASSARNGHVEVIKLLLNAGAQREIAVEDGRTPLELARQYDHPDAVSVLMAYSGTR